MKMFFNKNKIKKLHFSMLLPVFFLSLFSVNTFAQKDSLKTRNNDLRSRYIHNTDNPRQTFQSLIGKKVWVIVLPDSLKMADSSLLVKIDSIAATRTGMLRTLVIPAISKSGFINDGGPKFEKFYTQMRRHDIIFSIPVTTRKKNRKANADDLLTWLTDESANGHFSKEPDESGIMYLIDEKGQLQGAFEMNTIWNRQFMKIIFQ